MTLVTGNSECALIRSAASRSVSRDAVPLPIAMSSTWCAAASRASVAMDWSHCRFGSCGKIVPVATGLPVLSSTATLTPVRNPGSRPIVGRVPAGAASSRSRRLAAKTATASSSARCHSRIHRSTLRCTAIRVRQAQRTVSASQRSAGRLWAAIPARPAIRVSYSLGAPSSPGSMVSSRTCSFSPRIMARIRCAGSAVNGSSNSK